MIAATAGSGSCSYHVPDPGLLSLTQQLLEVQYKLVNIIRALAVRLVGCCEKPRVLLTPGLLD